VSAAGRGPRRGGPDDCFPTPAWVVDRLLDVWAPRPGTLLEPAAGDGALIAAVNAKLGARQWLAVECRATAASACRAAGAVPVVTDFLTWEPPAGTTDDVSAVITNPPFSLCEEFIRHADEICPAADLVFLVRLGFLASAQRVTLWRDVGVPDVNVLPNRPSFTGDSRTDSSDYAWIVIPAVNVDRPVGAFRVLATTATGIRRPARPKPARPRAAKRAA
jgi:hypothetical protein